jgi:hypothetical protein
MRSWSKWKIFSRKWKSSSSVGPRGMLIAVLPKGALSAGHLSAFQTQGSYFQTTTGGTIGSGGIGPG